MTHVGRPPTGSIKWADPETKTTPIGVRVTRPNGKRKLVRFDPGTTAADAIALAPGIADGARFAVDESEGETVTEYAKRWCEWREARGVGCVADDRTRLALHALPTIGLLPIAEDRAKLRTELKKLVALPPPESQLVAIYLVIASLGIAWPWLMIGVALLGDLLTRPGHTRAGGMTQSPAW